MTVSNVLRPKDNTGRRLFTEKTARRVRKAAEKLGYLPNRAARAMRTHQTGVVGFVAANFAEETHTVENVGVHPFLVGLNHVLTPTGRHVAFVELKELELGKSVQLPDALRENFFDALVVHYGLSQRALGLLQRSGIPLIYWDSGLFHKENCVYRDEFEVGRVATRRLLDLGHRQIAFAGGRGSWSKYQAGEPIHYSFVGRYEGYVAALKAQGLQPFVLLDYDVQGLADQIVRGGITGVVVQTTYMAILRAAFQLGKRVPQDISVLACDLESSVPDRGDMAGGVRYKRYDAGRIVGELLLKRMATGGQPVPSVRLPIEIADGSTSAPISTPI